MAVRNKIATTESILVIGVFLFANFSLLGQNNKIDSLKTQLLNLTNTESFETTCELAIEYFPLDGEKGLEYARQAKIVATTTNNNLGFVKSLRLIGQMQRRLNNLDSAVFYFKMCLPLAKGLNDYEEQHNILNGIGLALSFQANYDEALSFHLQALDLAIKKKDTPRIDRSLFNLGLVYYKLTNYNLALDYYNKSLQLKLANKEVRDLEMLAINISLCYAYLGKLTDARKILLPFLKKCSANSQTELSMMGYYASGVIFLKSDSLTKAEQEFLLSYTIAKKIINDHRFVFDNIIFLSKIYMKKGDLNGAEKFLLEGESMTKSDHFDLEEIKLFEELSALYRLKGDNRKLTIYQEKYIQLRDSTFNEKLTNNLMLLHSEATEKENKARLAFQEQTMGLKKQIIERQMGINVLIGLMILVMAVLTYLLSRIVQSRKSANLLLDQKVKHRTDELNINHRELILAISKQDALIVELSRNLETSLAAIQTVCSSRSNPETNSFALQYFQKINSTTATLNETLCHLLDDSKIVSEVTAT